MVLEQLGKTVPVRKLLCSALSANSDLAGGAAKLLAFSAVFPIAQGDTLQSEKRLVRST